MTLPPIDPSPPAPAHLALLRAGRALVMAIVIGALGLVGYDAWLWVFAGDALARLTGVQVDAQLQFQVRLVPVGAAAASTHARPLPVGNADRRHAPP